MAEPKSQLLTLLEKKGSPDVDLTVNELIRASMLIGDENAPINGECLVCGKPAIYDTSLCVGHAVLLLAVKK